MWTHNQRNSWHGVEYPYHSDLSIADYYKLYAETLLAVDDSVGRVLDVLEKRGELDSTYIFFAGDNGFCFGEHGLIDKRQAYEESMRIPLLVRCPDNIPRGSVINEMVANIDFMPTFLEAAGVPSPAGLAGESFLPLLEGRRVPWRKDLLYTYYWERNFPQTPTMHAIRTDRYKYIHYYGIWDATNCMISSPIPTNKRTSSIARRTARRSPISNANSSPNSKPKAACTSRCMLMPANRTTSGTRKNHTPRTSRRNCINRPKTVPPTPAHNRNT